VKQAVCDCRLAKGTSINPEFAQMQGVEKISPRRIWVICKQKFFLRNTAVEMKSGFLEVP
jgi:hypothetical protein